MKKIPGHHIWGPGFFFFPLSFGSGRLHCYIAKSSCDETIRNLGKIGFINLH